MTKRPRILVCGWIGSTNRGDDLIAAAVADLIRQEGGDPTVVTIDDTTDRLHGAPAVVHRRPLDTIGLFSAARAHDGLVFGGGGLIQDETGPLNLPFHLSRLLVGRLNRLPWIGLALGVGDVRRRTGRALVRAIMRQSTALTVRDRGSRQRLHRLTGTEPVLGIDPVVTIEPTPPAAEPVLAVALRPPNRPDQRRTADTALDPSLIDAWAAAIDALAEAHELDVRFVAWDPHHDTPVHEAVAARLRRPSTLEEPEADRIIGRMGASTLVLTMRYHGAVAAALTGRPAVVLDYSPKMGDLVAETSHRLALVDPGAAAETLIDAGHRMLATAPPPGDPRPAERIAANRDAVRRLIAAAQA